MKHRRDAGWLNDLKGKTQVGQQHDLTIDIDKLRAILRKIPNWKASGVQGRTRILVEEHEETT